jgi:hypothetical protein
MDLVSVKKAEYRMVEFGRELHDSRGTVWLRGKVVQSDYVTRAANLSETRKRGHERVDSTNHRDSRDVQGIINTKD